MNSSTGMIVSVAMFFTLGITLFANAVIQRLDVLLDDNPSYPLSLEFLNMSFISMYAGAVLIGVSIISYHLYSQQRDKERTLWFRPTVNDVLEAKDALHSATTVKEPNK